jgi:hypothetical protein
MAHEELYFGMNGWEPSRRHCGRFKSTMAIRRIQQNCSLTMKFVRMLPGIPGRDESVDC